MPTLILAVVASSIISQSSSSPSAPRSYHEIHQQLRSRLRAESVARTEPERAMAIRNLVALYRELKRDPRSARAPTLKRYQAMVWSRLVRVRKELEKSLKRLERQRRVADRTGGRQQSPVPQEPAVGPAQALADQLALVSFSLGGPGRLLAEAERHRFGGGAAAQNAAELIELIHSVIAPESWDVHGGTSTIVYYAPLQALVIRATSRVHDAVGGTLKGLREAGP